MPAVALALVAAAAAGTRQQAVRADAPAGTAPVLVDVQGGPIGDIALGPLQVSPAFSPATHDYVMPCSTGANAVQLTITAAPGHAVAYGTRARQSVTASTSLVEGQALVVQSDAQGPQGQYWFRCLPHDFPAMTVRRPGSPAPGWYLTGIIARLVPSSSANYAMILDGNGTPVWYAPNPLGAANVQPEGTNAVSFWGTVDPAVNQEKYGVFSLDGGSVGYVGTVGTQTDLHELLHLPNGNTALIAYPTFVDAGDLVTGDGVDHGTGATVVDCEIQEIDPSGTVVWQWFASQHVGFDESLNPIQNSQGAWDVYHCNSVDEDASGNVVVSMREVDAVFDVDRAGKSVVWKLGGNAPDPPDHATVEHLTTLPDASANPSGQHDARLLPGGDLSLYDDQTFVSGGVARGSIFHLDHALHTATLVQQFPSATGRAALFTGSFRVGADGSDVVGWGGLPQGPAFTDYDSHGNVQLELTFPNSEVTYRTIKVPPQTFDVNLLRRTAGRNLQPPPVPQPPPGQPVAGYWLACGDGGVFPIGSARGFGSLGGVRLNAPVVGIAATPDGGGYWLVASDGGVFPFGDAAGHGSTGGVRLNSPVVGMAATPDGGGYWLVAADGGVFPFGDAAGHGSTGGVRLNSPVVGMASTPDGGGYWLVAADGGIFPFGDATGLGSTGGVRLNSPIVGMAATPGGAGYWLVAADGGVFPFGDATGFGSMGGTPLNGPVVGVATPPLGDGYWMAGRDGGIFPFGSAAGYGSLGSQPLNAPVVGIAA